MMEAGLSWEWYIFMGIGRGYSGGSIFASRLICGDCGGSYLFAAYTGNMEWENGELLSPEEKLGFVRAASESLTGADAIVFLDDDNKSLFIDWRGMPFAHIQRKYQGQAG